MRDRSLAVWNALLGKALELPGVRIDRGAFLSGSLGAHVPEHVLAQAVANDPHSAGVEPDLIARLSKASIGKHRALATATSTLTGLPGGFWVAATLPADLSQLLWHVLVVSQKLAYLHGFPQLLPAGGDVDDEAALILTLFVGVVLGVEGANLWFSKGANVAASDVLASLPRAPFNKLALRNAAVQVSKWFGVKMTKQQLGQLLGRGVPLVGGVFGGALTWLTFGKGAERLREQLAAAVQTKA